MGTLTWGHRCSALWIWGSAWRRSRLPAHTAPGWCLQWSWTCQTWPGRTLSWCYFHHLEGKKGSVWWVDNTITRKQCEVGKKRFPGAIDWVSLENILLSSYGNNECLMQERGNGGRRGCWSRWNVPESLLPSPSATFSTTGNLDMQNKWTLVRWQTCILFIKKCFVFYLSTVQTLSSSYSSCRRLLSRPHQSHTCLYHYLRQREQAF